MRKLINSAWSVVLIANFAAGCSLFKIFDNEEDSADRGYGSKDYVEALVSSAPSDWFSGDKKFALLNAQGRPAPHMFFDVDPAIEEEKRLLNFVAPTPEGSKIERGLNLASGQIYAKRKYCPQEDAWNKYPGEIYLPPYTAGVVPRTLDQLNRPQKIIVFGQQDYYQEYFLTNYFDARIVGGFIERICPERGCPRKDDWLSRLVLVGVQKDNEKYAKVRNLADLKKHVDWEAVKAFAANGGGGNNVGGNLYPAYRVGAEVGPGQAMAFLKRGSRVFLPRELEQMKNSCRRLYDYIWDSLASADEKDFEQKFRLNFYKFRDRYNTCSKYVYPASVNHDPDRHWFFAYLGAFYRLSEEGYYYDCRRGVWRTNPRLESGQRAFSRKEQLRNCEDGFLDQAMPRMVRFMEVLRERGRPSRRYVDYDNTSWGTHQKLYAWTDTDNKFLECSKDAKGNYLKNKLPVFPKDAPWKGSPKAKEKNGVK